jgi:energy-coupling factor transporter ATP-binding protein EcfA2
MAEKMADRLAAARRREFVGRQDELAIFQAVVHDGDNGSVVFVYGPGGVGKSTMLRQFAWIGEQAGRIVVRIDGRETGPVPTTALAEIAAAAGCGGADDPLAELGRLKGLLVLVDTAEMLMPLDRWFREEFLPALSADTIAVFAGRSAPSLAWRTDPGWRGLLHSMRLENLNRADSQTLLSLRGVPPDQHDAALAFTCGHPLALALVADVAAQGSHPLQASGTPEVVSALLATLVETVPSALHRAALEACAQVKTTTEPLLADLLEIEDARDLFGWLRELSIIDVGPRGLYPHDLAREALASELRWRHPEQYATIHRRAGAYYQAQFYAANPIAQGAVLVDYVYLHRDSPILGPFVASTAVGNQDMSSLTVSALRPDEHGLIRDAVARHEGEESAALFDHWYERLPQCVVIVRGVDGEAAGREASGAGTSMGANSAGPAACAHRRCWTPG